MQGGWQQLRRVGDEKHPIMGLWNLGVKLRELTCNTTPTCSTGITDPSHCRTASPMGLNLLTTAVAL